MEPKPESLQVAEGKSFQTDLTLRPTRLYMYGKSSINRHSERERFIPRRLSEGLSAHFLFDDVCSKNYSRGVGGATELPKRGSAHL